MPLDIKGYIFQMTKSHGSLVEKIFRKNIYPTLMIIVKGMHYGLTFTA